MPLDFEQLTERILDAVFEVSNTLGSGFLEKVYERALLKETALRRIRATTQTSFPSPTKATMSASTTPTSSLNTQ